ncbi:MAG: hypothetical protein ACK5B6_09990 [Bacteroidia bacterium]|jgi:hypothetical protein
MMKWLKPFLFAENIQFPMVKTMGKLKPWAIQTMGNSNHRQLENCEQPKTGRLKLWEFMGKRAPWAIKIPK